MRVFKICDNVLCRICDVICCNMLPNAYNSNSMSRYVCDDSGVVLFFFFCFIFLYRCATTRMTFFYVYTCATLVQLNYYQLSITRTHRELKKVTMTTMYKYDLSSN
jgi:hypothetical protein